MRLAKHLLPVGLALGATGLISCSTPKPECTVAASNRFGAGLSGLAAYAVKLTPVSGTGACAELRGEVVGMQAYHPASASDPQIRDFSKTSIAIRTLSNGELFFMNEDFGFDNSANTPNAIGEFTAIEPDSSELCQVPSAESHVVFPGATVDTDAEVACTTDQDCTDGGADGATCKPIDPNDPAAGSSCFFTDVFEATDITYKWSNLSFYVTAAATGSQFTADLEVVLNGCTATYKAIGMWPAVDCTGYTEFDAEGNPTATGPLDEYCHPDADPKKAGNPRPYGSGINPDFGPVKCDPNFGPLPIIDQYTGSAYSTSRCVLDTDTIPALGGFPELTPAE